MINPKLEETFNIKRIDATKLESEELETTENILDVLQQSAAEFDKIDAALPRVEGLEANEEEMDELARMATEGFNNLMDLGMQVETRHAAEIFGAASNLLGHALTAKKNKLEKKLKVLELQLKKKHLDLKERQFTIDEAQNIVPGKAEVIDRNKLIAQIRNPGESAK